MKEYGELLDTDEARAFRPSASATSPSCSASVEPRAPRGPVPLRVAYHDACHLAHAQGVRAQPRELLRSIPGLELLEVAAERGRLLRLGRASTTWCSPRRPPSSAPARRRTCSTPAPQAIAAGNPGCAAQLDLHLRELGQPLPIYHPIELVWRSIAA